MDIHFLKSRSNFFSDLFSRRRFFETRLNDRGFSVGDLVVFEEVFPPDYLIPNIYDPRTVPRCAAAEINYVGSDFPGLESGFCVLGLTFLGSADSAPVLVDEKPPAFVDNAYYDQGGIPMIDILFAKLSPAQFEGFLLGSAIKYAVRLNWKVKAEGAASVSVADAVKLRNYSSWLSHLLEFGRDSFAASLKGSLPPFHLNVSGVS